VRNAIVHVVLTWVHPLYTRSWGAVHNGLNVTSSLVRLANDDKVHLRFRATGQPAKYSDTTSIYPAGRTAAINPANLGLCIVVRSQRLKLPLSVNEKK
jgi:hypothetical protein